MSRHRDSRRISPVFDADMGFTGLPRQRRETVRHALHHFDYRHNFAAWLPLAQRRGVHLNEQAPTCD